MAKSLLTAKLIGGGILGTGAVAAGGIGIDQYIKSNRDSVSQEESVDTRIEDVESTVTQTDITPTPPSAQPEAASGVSTGSNSPSGPSSGGDQSSDQRSDVNAGTQQTHEQGASSLGTAAGTGSSTT